MFRKMRRIKNEIAIEEAKALLKNNKRAAFSVNGDGGYPYTIPINFYYDEDENKIYFHSAKKGHKIDSIIKNDKVCALPHGTMDMWRARIGHIMFQAVWYLAERGWLKTAGLQRRK